MALNSPRSHGLGAGGDTTAPFSIDSLVQDLTMALNNPTSSPICALRMRVAADRIEDELNSRKSVTSKIQFSKSFPQLLRASIKFLTFKQPQEAHDAMLDQLSRCRCVGFSAGQSEMARLHTPTKSYGTYKLAGQPEDKSKSYTHVMAAVDTLCELLAFTLSDLTSGRFRSEKSKSDPARQPWPQNEHDLLPYGCVDSVDGLDLWVTKPGGWAILRLSTALTTFYQPFAQAIFRPPQYTFVLGRAIDHLTAMVAMYETVSPSDYALDYPDVDKIIQYIFNYWQILMTYTGPTFGTMLHSRKSALGPVLARLLPIVNAKKNDITWTEIRHFVLSILLVQSSVDASGVGKYQDIELKLDDILGILNEESIIVENYLDFIVAVRKGGCLNIACPVFEKNGSVYAKLCSQCKLVRFCSEKCQKEAWRNREYPHRVLCGKSAALKERLGIKDWGDFGKVRDSPPEEFIALCKRKGVHIGAFSEVGAMVHGTHTAKTVYQKEVLGVTVASSKN